MSNVEYVYVRLKNVFSEEQGLELFLFAGLTKITESSGVDSRTKKVEAIVSKLLETPVTDALSVYSAMNDEDLRVVIDKSEFERLQQLAEEDEEAFFTYLPNKI